MVQGPHIQTTGLRVPGGAGEGHLRFCAELGVDYDEFEFMRSKGLFMCGV